MAGELEERNREYDHADHIIWRTAVFDAVHGGRWFANIGGQYVLDKVAAQVGGGALLELCSGMGDTCAYLAEKYGFRVTGVEMNPFQVGRARERAAAHGVEAKVRFVEGDVSRWIPEGEFDGIYCLDSLVYVRLDWIFGACRRSLRPGGSMVLAELTAGPLIDEEAREYAAADGFINLLTADEYAQMLEQSGFVEVEVHDLTTLGAECFTTIHATVKAKREALLGECPRAAVDGWEALSRTYAKAFGQRRFLYSMIVARVGTSEALTPDEAQNQKPQTKDQQGRRSEASSRGS